MKVLILHQHFNTPEGGGPLRSYYLAKALVDNGIAVAVITGGKNATYTRTDFEGIEIHSLPVSYENRYGFYRRGFSFMRYALDAVKVAGKIKGITICYAISVPLTVGQCAIWIERKYGVPFYFEVGDLWPEAPVQMGFVQNPFLKHSLYWLERRVYKKAKMIVALSEPIKESIARKCASKPITVIPNMADTSFFQPRGQIGGSNKNKFVISYIGAVGFANGLDYFIECARACSQQNLPAEFVICGEGAMIGNLKSAVNTLRLQNIRFLPFQNREGVKQLMDATDAAFICYRPFPILETGSPNKYFDGLAAGKVIFVNFRGWIKDEIIKYDCGLDLDPKNPREIVEKLKPYLDSRDLVQRQSANARRLAEEKYSRAGLSKKFVSLFSNR